MRTGKEILSTFPEEDFWKAFDRYMELNFSELGEGTFCRINEASTNCLEF